MNLPDHLVRGSFLREHLAMPSFPIVVFRWPYRPFSVDVFRCSVVDFFFNPFSTLINDTTTVLDCLLNVHFLSCKGDEILPRFLPLPAEAGAPDFSPWMKDLMHMGYYFLPYYLSNDVGHYISNQRLITFRNQGPAFSHILAGFYFHTFLSYFLMQKYTLFNFREL